MSEEIAAEFWQGVEQFNQREYYACHDTLEAIWMEASEPQKSFYQGILQIAVALYHLGNQNLRGAIILLGEGVHRLRRYLPDYAAVNVASLVEQSVDLLTMLQQAQPQQVPLFAAQVTAQVRQPGADSTAPALPHLPVITMLESSPG